MTFTSSLSSKSVLVTGGSAGIGFAIAEGFARAGAAVAICGRDAGRIESATRSLRALAAIEVLGFRADVSQSVEVARLFDDLQTTRGGIDILVNNAGAATHGLVSDLDESAFDLVMAVNVKGVFLCSQQMVRRARARDRRGVIVNVASQAAKRPYPYVAHYCAAKAAVVHFTRALALEAAPLVRVNAVCPGIVETEMIGREYQWREANLGESPEAVRERWERQTPSRRLQDGADIASAVLFLASDASSQTYGEAMNVSGGMVME